MVLAAWLHHNSSWLGSFVYEVSMVVEGGREVGREASNLVDFIDAMMQKEMGRNCPDQSLCNVDTCLWRIPVGVKVL